MANVMGKDSVIKIDNAAGSLTDMTTYVTNVDGLPGDVETDDTTTMGHQARTSIPGLKAASKVSVGFVWDDGTGASTVDGAMAAMYTAGGQLTGLGSISCEWSPGGTAAGKRKYSCEMWLKSYAITSTVGSKVTAKAEFEVTGGVTVGTN